MASGGSHNNAGTAPEGGGGGGGTFDYDYAANGSYVNATAVAASSSNNIPVGDMIAKLEQELETTQLELTTVTKERDRQLSQLQQLQEEHETLKNQKDIRAQRTKLQQQLSEIDDAVHRKALVHQSALEDLEQQKSHNRQLRRTLHLLQDAVGQILEKSANDHDHSRAGKDRAAQRQHLLRQILMDKNWNSSNPHLALTASHNNNIDNEDDEDEDIYETTQDGASGIRLISSKARMESIDSMFSEIMSMNSFESQRSSPPSHRSRSRAAKSQSTNSGHHRSRSTHSHGSSNSNKSNRSKSHRSSSSKSRSRSRKRMAGRRPRSNVSVNSNNTDDDNHDHKKTSLEYMLSQGGGERDSDEESADTPRTTNSNRYG